VTAVTGQTAAPIAPRRFCARCSLFPRPSRHDCFGRNGRLGLVSGRRSQSGRRLGSRAGSRSRPQARTCGPRAARRPARGRSAHESPLLPSARVSVLLLSAALAAPTVERERPRVPMPVRREREAADTWPRPPRESASPSRDQPSEARTRDLRCESSPPAGSSGARARACRTGHSCCRAKR
jgi:hypothetical protein